MISEDEIMKARILGFIPKDTMEAVLDELGCPVDPGESELHEITLELSKLVFVPGVVSSLLGRGQDYAFSYLQMTVKKYPDETKRIGSEFIQSVIDMDMDLDEVRKLFAIVMTTNRKLASIFYSYKPLTNWVHKNHAPLLSKILADDHPFSQEELDEIKKRWEARDLAWDVT
jgi:hypothetical protein